MIRPVQQRTAGDCGTAALATLLSDTHSYEDVWLHAAAVANPERAKRGLTHAELLEVGRRLTVTLVARRKHYDLAVDDGLARVFGVAFSARGHWVAVRYGLLWDSADGSAAPWPEYAARHRATVRTFLKAYRRGR